MDMKKGMIGIIGVIVVIIMFAALLPIVTGVIDDTDATGTTAILLDNLPLFMALGVVVAIIGYSLYHLRGGE